MFAHHPDYLRSSADLKRLTTPGSGLSAIRSRKSPVDCSLFADKSVVARGIADADRHADLPRGRLDRRIRRRTRPDLRTHHRRSAAGAAFVLLLGKSNVGCGSCPFKQFPLNSNFSERNDLDIFVEQNAAYYV